jgi:hypothetical protein
MSKLFIFSGEKDGSNIPKAACEHPAVSDGVDDGPNFVARISPRKVTVQTSQQSVVGSKNDEGIPELLLQPEPHPISLEQLVTEVKAIYANLFMVEAKCIEVDEKQLQNAQDKDPNKTKLTGEQWQALITLHKTLLHQHHDFFLASQHPSASVALSRLGAKYSMPARMWRHGIHSLLEILRYRLPDSLEHMLVFIHVAYSTIILLYETVPAFAKTWIEFLGDLGRYRMAIEDGEANDHEVWRRVARMWYTKASDKSPHVGRLYHHMAILEEPFTVQQFSLYLTALTCVEPFENARISIMTILKPIFENNKTVLEKSSNFDVTFIKGHALNLLKRPKVDFEQCLELLTSEKESMFNKYVESCGPKAKTIGVAIALCNVGGCFQYGTIRPGGKTISLIRLGFGSELAQARKLSTDCASTIDNTHEPSPPSPILVQADLNQSEETDGLVMLDQANRIAFGLLASALSTPSNTNLYPMIHVYLVFLAALLTRPAAVALLGNHVPRTHIANFLNSLGGSSEIKRIARLEHFPDMKHEAAGRPLPEDWVLRGQVYECFPTRWFLDANVDDEERLLELPSMEEVRLLRLKWLGHCIAAAGIWISYDEDTDTFSPIPYGGVGESTTTTDEIMVDAENFFST